MKKTILGLACLSLFGGAFGCASSAEHERREAMRHEYRAQRAAAYGDYDRAAAEQRQANIDRQRAAAKAVDEADDSVRSNLPPPATPLPRAY